VGLGAEPEARAIISGEGRRGAEKEQLLNNLRVSLLECAFIIRFGAFGFLQEDVAGIQ